MFLGSPFANSLFKNIEDKPFNFDNHFSYFPLNIDDPQGEGYYLSYQSAQNGENVKVTDDIDKKVF